MLGIWLHESGVLGASPDGIVRKAITEGQLYYQSSAAVNLIPEIVEVKCPYSGRNYTVCDAAKTVDNFPLCTYTSDIQNIFVINDTNNNVNINVPNIPNKVTQDNKLGNVCCGS